MYYCMYIMLSGIVEQCRNNRTITKGQWTYNTHTAHYKYYCLEISFLVFGVPRC